MTLGELLTDAFNRIREDGEAAVSGLSPEQLAERPTHHSNSIGWLVWHLARIQDDHIADVAGLEQVWTRGGWRERFGLPFGRFDTGYGHTPDQVAQLAGVTSAQLVGYLDEVHRQTLGYVANLSAEDLGRIVDERWDPPVTLGVRLVSIVNDDNQHVGQAAFVRGLITA